MQGSAPESDTARERERDRERERERETERERDRETDRQTDRETERERETHTHTHTHTDRQISAIPRADPHASGPRTVNSRRYALGVVHAGSRGKHALEKRQELRDVLAQRIDDGVGSGIEGVRRLSAQHSTHVTSQLRDRRTTATRTTVAPR